MSNIDLYQVLQMLGCWAIALLQYQADSSPIVFVALALDSWNYCCGEQGLTAQHLPLNVWPNMISLNKRKCATLWQRVLSYGGSTSFCLSVDPSIIFTAEENIPDGSMPFLDTLLTPQIDGTLRTSVYRKPTHTDSYLQWDSHHNGLQIQCDPTPSHTGPEQFLPNPQLLKEEPQHLEEVLMKCKHPKWAIDEVLQKEEDTRMKNRRNHTTRTNQRRSVI